MQIVIDIPDDVYDECKGDVYFPDTGGIVWEGVRNGTPLPKGHGRLIDANELCEGRVSNDTVVIAAKCASTIIEAYKAESEK